MSKTIGCDTSKSSVAFVLTEKSGKDFKVETSEIISFSVDDAQGIRDLEKAVSQVLLAYEKKGAKKLAIVKKSNGKMASSVEAVKAHAIVELTCVTKTRLELKPVSSLSFKGALGTPQGTKWQEHAKQMLNAKGEIKQWAKVGNAVVAAFKIAAE